MVGIEDHGVPSDTKGVGKKRAIGGKMKNGENGVEVGGWGVWMCVFGVVGNG